MFVAKKLTAKIPDIHFLLSALYHPLIKHSKLSLPQNTTARLRKQKILPKLSGKKLPESISNDVKFNIRCSHSQKPQIPYQPPAHTTSCFQACAGLPLLFLFICLPSGNPPINALLSLVPPPLCRPISQGLTLHIYRKL